MYYGNLPTLNGKVIFEQSVGQRVSFFFEGVRGEVTIKDYFKRVSKKGKEREYVVLDYKGRRGTYLVYNFFKCGIEKIVKPKKPSFDRGEIVDRYTVLGFEVEEKFNPDGTIRLRDWVKTQCNECGIVKNIRVDHMGKHTQYCYDCNNSKRRLTKLNKIRSYGESIMEEVLTQQGLNYKPEKTFEWLPGRRYDFYLPDLNTVVEVHGVQHYEEQGKGQRFHLTLEHQQEVDKLKKESALSEGLDYVEIDAREHTFEFIKNNIINSDIPTSKVDWSKVYMNTTGNKVIKDIIKGYNEGLTLSEISNITKLSNYTITNRLEGLQSEGFIEGYDKYEMSIRYHRKSLEELLSKRDDK